MNEDQETTETVPVPEDHLRNVLRAVSAALIDLANQINKAAQQ